MAQFFLVQTTMQLFGKSRLSPSFVQDQKFSIQNYGQLALTDSAQLTKRPYDALTTLPANNIFSNTRQEILPVGINGIFKFMLRKHFLEILGRFLRVRNARWHPAESQAIYAGIQVTQERRSILGYGTKT
jgi:hypothetical protein